MTTYSFPGYQIHVNGLDSMTVEIVRPEIKTFSFTLDSNSSGKADEICRLLDSEPIGFSRNAREGRYGGRIKGQHVRGWIGQSLIENRRKS